MNAKLANDRERLTQIAYQAMLERGLLPEFSPEVLAELSQIKSPAPIGSEPARDLRSRLWASIDNDDSRDLDQLTTAEPGEDGQVKVLVAVADVDALIKKGSTIDQHALHNTASVYTPAVIFPMLPDKLSTNLTSLNLNEDRLAVVIDMTVRPNGALAGAAVYQAAVRSQARLSYDPVAAWLDGTGEMPSEVKAVPGLAENLRLQDQAAQQMKQYRHAHGALTLETISALPVMEDDTIVGLVAEHTNRANEMVENFMIAANGVTARFLESKKFPSIRRVVLAPQRWDRIMDLAAEYGVTLPNQPDAVALEKFLIKRKAADPLRFPDLSLAVVKMIGGGQYVAELPSDQVPDHFSLAARDYTHSTAPNRRYTDLVTQRLLKAAIQGQPAPYRMEELTVLAQHCTEAEDEGNKVERQANKSAAALLLQTRIDSQYDAIITGTSPKATWVRTLAIPVEGRLVEGFERLDVGDRLRVQLISVDVQRGFIDFKRIK